jgi:hypothetical protein
MSGSDGTLYEYNLAQTHLFVQICMMWYRVLTEGLR